MTKTYREKLMDPRWQKKRLLIFERDKWGCVRCGSTTSNLQVHHKKYTGEPWEAPDNDLETICDVCHKAEHMIEEVRIERPMPINQVYELSKHWAKFGIEINQEVDREMSEKTKRLKDLQKVRSETCDMLKDNTDEDSIMEILLKLKEMDANIMLLRKEIHG